MTDKELQKLKRTDLLEILVEQGKEIEKLRAEKEVVEEKLRDRTICIDKAGTIAEASFQLNGVFEAAHAAAAQYLENIQHLSERQENVCAQMERESREKCEAMERETTEKCETMERETTEKCETMERETTEKCETMLAEAQKGVDERWMEISKRLEAFYDAHRGLRELLTMVGGANLDQ